jgi:predicted nucleotidyltransferase
MIESSIVDIAVRRLAETYNPEAIFLFGSYAWGDPEKASDIDILTRCKKFRTKTL